MARAADFGGFEISFSVGRAVHRLRIFIELTRDCWFHRGLNTKNIFTFYGRIHPFASRRHQE